MNGSVVQSLRKKRYFVVGITALWLLVLALLLGVRAQTPMSKAMSFWWSVTTGTALAICIAHQWTLLLARLGDHGQEARGRSQRHRQVGVAAVCLFLLHAGSVGYALLTVLASVFLVVAITGLFNSEVIPLTRPRLRLCWSYLHIALSGVLLPLIAFHAWAALAFK